MKKIISLLIVLLVLLSCFSLSASANEDIYDYEENIYIGVGSGSVITFSDDFAELNCANNRYTRFDDSEVYSNEETCNVINSIELNDKQLTKVKKIDLSGTKNGSIVWAYIDYIDGAYMEISFIHSDYAEIYNQGMKDDWQTATIDFGWDEKNIVTVSRDILCGEKTYLITNTDSFEEMFYVELHPDNCDFYFKKGELISYQGDYYYLDYKELGIDSSSGFYSEEVINFEAYKITDENFLDEIENAVEDYYSSDLGFMEDNDFTKAVSDFFAVILFVVLPLAVLILFVILAIRSRTPIYKRLFYTISALSLAELATFGAIVLYIFVNKK